METALYSLENDAGIESPSLVFGVERTSPDTDAYRGMIVFCLVAL